MDLPISENELRDIVIALQIASGQSQNPRFQDLSERLKLVEQLIAEGKPYKKILREEYGMVA
jgi:hypothetical protein